MCSDIIPISDLCDKTFAIVRSALNFEPITDEDHPNAAVELKKRNRDPKKVSGVKRNYICILILDI